MEAVIRDYRPEDLGRVLQLWERSGPDGAAEGVLTLDQSVDLLSSDSAAALVAEVSGEIVGMALGSVVAAVGWVHRLALLPDQADEQRLADQLLESLESRLAEAGARGLNAVVDGDGGVRGHLQRRDYRAVAGAVPLRREVPAMLAVPSGLAEVFGTVINPGLWSELKGLEQAKEIIERRVILPLAEPELAQRHAVRPPRAIVLFGPPGTGKTTFAKGIASRLGWPFVEIRPGELAGEGAEHQARLLGETFDRVLELPAAIVFVDEVEDLASIRHQERRVSPSVTNEFLIQIPRLREAGQHLLVCATNAVERLDPAFLRPGRFDYVLPVGPPDERARESIWRRYTGEITDEEIDLDRLVDASELFTPADIEFAARKAAQRAFEREHFEGASHRARTEDFAGAIEQTRPTLTAEMLDGFEAARRAHARY